MASLDSTKSPAECSDRRIWIKITDTGAGIDTAFLPHVFDRFRQADNAKSRTFGGLGLGLSGQRG